MITAFPGYGITIVDTCSTMGCGLSYKVLLFWESKVAQKRQSRTITFLLAFSQSKGNRVNMKEGMPTLLLLPCGPSLRVHAF